MKVLVVDDDALTREMLKHALSEDGHEVLTARDGREALKIIRKTSCRMVISDWQMPYMNGLELCRAIRAGGFSAYTYFILLTQNGRSDEIVEGLSAGADDYITKPFETAELKVRIRAGERILSLETRDMTIFAMAKLAESRDPVTGAHLERVRGYSKIIAEHLNTVPEYVGVVNGDYVGLIYLTSPLHDIGKVAIPDRVLCKPGKLTVEEFEIMKTHAMHGAETLDAALREFPRAEFLIMAREIAAYHHERWDGGGYSEGLAGEDIPLSARIVALADVYDALTSKRVYKEAYSHEEAYAIILQERGRHFDPNIVDAFVENEQAFIAIRQRYADQGRLEVSPGDESELRRSA